MIDTWLQTFSELMGDHSWLAPVLALAAGVLSAFSPCALSTIPLVIGYVGGRQERNTRRAFGLSAVLALGMAITLTALGLIASAAGRLAGGGNSWWYLLLGVLMVLMALQTWEIIRIVPSTYAVDKNRRKGFAGAFLAGILAGLFSSPCSTPVLVVLLAFVASQGSVAQGGMLLFLYAVGNSTLVLLAGTAVGFVQKLSSDPRYGRLSMVLRIVTGTLILLLGLYMFYIAF